MSILDISPVKRDGIKLLISLFGESETGKTLSALKLMAGIEPDPRKRLLLDTEGGQRGRFYYDAIPGGYMYASLSPPYSPLRYVQAFDEIEAAGITCCTTDSISHAWFAEGGVLDQAEQSTVKNDMAKWKKPKREIEKMNNRIKRANMHMIICARGKRPLIKQGAEYVQGPVVPVQDKNLRYDLTIIAKMLGDGKFTIAKEEGGKCPGMLREIFGRDALINEAMGRSLIDWIGAETLKTPAQRLLDRAATDAAEGGTASYATFWSALNREDRAYLLPQHGNLKSVAAIADAEAQKRMDEEREEGNGDPRDPFPPTPSERLTIEPASGADPSSIKRGLLARIASFELASYLVAWRALEATEAAISSLGADDGSEVEDAYEARRGALAAKASA